ncbi:type II toxin-antitoxin system VapC family toxin [Nakamurella lactea]|uniref:type II toxin-antitoxin system VapC family toxin n=1 Tax=Nakamurella lactea TaxID=459515 RepID=UPI0004209F6A|nr:type II toxin-antitoxin system VapC family toxin [Nakamurella lactea]
MTGGPVKGLADTSVFIGAESGRAIRGELLPDEVFVSVVTIAELQAGVLAAADTSTRARRLATLDSVAALEPLPIDAAAAAEWATLRVRVHEIGRRINVNDLWIAAVAAANGLSVITQDADFDVLELVGGPPVIHV